MEFLNEKCRKTAQKTQNKIIYIRKLKFVL